MAAAPEAGNKDGGTANSGGTTTTQTEEPKQDIADQKITIKIHYPPDDTTRQQEDDKIARFQAKYPNVTIVKDDWQYSVNEIGVKMASNEAPTL